MQVDCTVVQEMGLLTSVYTTVFASFVKLHTLGFIYEFFYFHLNHE